MVPANGPTENQQRASHRTSDQAGYPDDFDAVATIGRASDSAKKHLIE
jgi:hypothetical protein